MEPEKNIEDRYVQRMDLTSISTYEELKTSLVTEIRNLQTGFIRTGYLLKVARDTELIYQKGYKSVTEFAKEELGLTKDVTSRFIYINDRYSEGGYSDRIQEKYSEFGVAKLSEMLNLPDNVAAELTPQHTREQIREIKKEVKEEQEITEIEHAMEEAEPVLEVLDTTLKCFLYNYLKENPEKYVAMHRAVTLGDSLPKKLCAVLAPSGINTIFTRIPSVGKLMLTIIGPDKEISVINVRNAVNEPEKYTWDEAAEYVMLTYKNDITPEENWEMIYSEDFPRENKPVKTTKKPVSCSSERTPDTPKKEPAKGVNTLQKKEKPAAVPQKEVQNGPQKVEQTQYPTHGNGILKEEKPEAETPPEKVEGTVVEKDPYAVRAEVCAKGLAEVIGEGRWKQALMINKELAEYLGILVKQSEKEDVPGQMTMEDYEENEDETEDQE